MVEPFKVRSTEPTHAVIEVFGGDNDLSHFVSEDMAEIRKGLKGDFAVLGLGDLAGGGGAVVREITRKGTRVVARLGEVDTGDPATIAQFIARGLVSYKGAAHVAIGFWDHGTGVFDEEDSGEVILRGHRQPLQRSGRARSTPARRLFRPFARLDWDVRARAMLHDDTNGGVLTNREAGAVLAYAFKEAGRTEPVDLIFSDTCLNGMVEVVEELRAGARVIVGSEELEPGDGWDYYQWFRLMSEAPPQSADEWARQAVQAFKRGYLDRPDQHPCTLAAFRTSGKITAAFKELVGALQAQARAGFLALLDARSRTQSFAHGYMMDTFDMEDFATRLKRASEAQAVKTACDGVLASLQADRIDTVALGAEVSGALGLAFWCPGSRSSFERVATTYRELAFNKATGWADYLAQHLGA